MLSIFNSKCNDLDNQRYLTYCRNVRSGAVNKKKGIDPASLPPTSNACKHHHSSRLYSKSDQMQLQNRLSVS